MRPAMTQGTPPSSYFDLEMLAAQLRKHSDDLSMYAGFLLNVLSAGAAYGVLVLVFQDGIGEGLLDFRSVGGVAPVVEVTYSISDSTLV